jgi:hypothetical protein
MRGEPMGPDTPAPYPSASRHGDSTSEAVARWLAFHVALYFQRCSRVDFESCRAWNYWGERGREDVDFTVNTGYCRAHRHHADRIRIKVIVLSDIDATVFTCEIFDGSTRTIERSSGRLTEQARSIISDIHPPTRQHMGCISWTALTPADSPPNYTLASRSDLPEGQEPRFGDPPPLPLEDPVGARTAGRQARNVIRTRPPISADSPRQGQGAAVGAVVQFVSQQAHDASLDYQIEQQLNRLRPQIYRSPPGFGEGVLAVVETQVFSGDMQTSNLTGCYVLGNFSSPQQGLQAFRRSNGMTVLAARNAQMQRQFYWGVLAAR